MAAGGKKISAKAVASTPTGKGGAAARKTSHSTKRSAGPGRSSKSPEPIDQQSEAEDSSSSTPIDDIFTAPEFGVDPTPVELLANGKSLVDRLLKVTFVKKDRDRAIEMLTELDDVLSSLETSLLPAEPSADQASQGPSTAETYTQPPGWTMFDFLRSEAVKLTKYLNKTKFATPLDQSVTIDFGSKHKRFVCNACFMAGYPPSACVFKNVLGVMGHRKSGSGNIPGAVPYPCLTPAKTKKIEKKLKNGGTTLQPIPTETLYDRNLHTRFSVPVDNIENDDYCNVFLEAEVVHSVEAVAKYKQACEDYNALVKGTSVEEKKQVAKVKKLPSSRWQMVPLTRSIQNMEDFNIHRHITEAIAKNIAEIASEKAEYKMVKEAEAKSGLEDEEEKGDDDEEDDDDDEDDE